MVRGSLLAPGMRKAILAEHARLLDLGATSTCWDQYWSWFEPNYNPRADGAPDEEGDRLLEVGRAIHGMVHDRDPRGTFSGEMITEQKVPILDYTWDWRNGADLEEDAPFRYVFPQVRLNANVNEHPRGALLAFADGGLLNIMPGQMHSHRLADCPELTATLRQLAALRRRFLRFFSEGQYRHVEGLTRPGAMPVSTPTLKTSWWCWSTPPTSRHPRQPASIRRRGAAYRWAGSRRSWRSMARLGLVLSRAATPTSSSRTACASCSSPALRADRTGRLAVRGRALEAQAISMPGRRGQ